MYFHQENHIYFIGIPFIIPVLYFVYYSRYYLTLLRLGFREYRRNKKKRSVVSYSVNKHGDRAFSASADYDEEEELPPVLKLD